LSLAAGFEKVRKGFQPAFWVANLSEMFERLSFYSQQAFLLLFLVEKVHLSEIASSQLMGIFGLAVYALPVLVGSLADRFGFRRALLVAYLIDGTGYFLLGSVNSSWMHSIRAAVPDYWLLFAILIFSAFGPALVKPCVVGSVAIASTEDVRSIGYAIYYWLVNIGGALGPILGAAAVAYFGMAGNFKLCALVVYVLVLFVLLFYRDPVGAAATRSTKTIRQALANTVLVLRNWRFVLFMLIFSGYWVTFYAFFVVMPEYVHKYVAPSLPSADIGRLLSIDALMIIFFQILVNHLTRKVAPFRAMIFGAVLASLSMITISLYSSVWMAVAALVVFSIGEMTQAPRYYEYISRLAPEGQQGVFMGYSFLPIALGYFVSGLIGGHLLHYYGEVVKKPYELWWVLAGIGALAVVLMALYNRVFVPKTAAAT
jgi:proton-dependent oligopeptide transporter, POT family